jgi:hypothetical protein
VSARSAPVGGQTSEESLPEQKKPSVRSGPYWRSAELPCHLLDPAFAFARNLGCLLQRRFKISSARSTGSERASRPSRHPFG